MSDALKPVGRTRLYEQVIERLGEHVLGEGLSKGSRLPTERELSARLGVSRASIAQAIVALEVQGIVETRHGGGIYLLRAQFDAEPVPDLMARQKRLPDVLDARDALETKLAALAATRRSDEDLAAIGAALDLMHSQVSAGEPAMEGDRQFHAAIVTAAHSTLLADFYAEIKVPIAESRLESLRQPGRPRQSLADHGRIADAIRIGDEDAAARAMHEHVDHVSQVRLLTWNAED